LHHKMDHEHEGATGHRGHHHPAALTENCRSAHVTLTAGSSWKSSQKFLQEVGCILQLAHVDPFVGSMSLRDIARSEEDAGDAGFCQNACVAEIVDTNGPTLAGGAKELLNERIIEVRFQ